MSYFFFLTLPPPPRSTLFPYTTLFRSSDITCLGKVIGGGLPVGAYGGRQAIMEHVAPAGKMYQAGTLSGNPLAIDRKSTRLNSSHSQISYAVFCLKKKKKTSSMPATTS